MKKIGIAGATGLVGETLIRVLESGPWRIVELRLFASGRSAGTRIDFQDNELEVKKLDPKGFKGLDVAFFCLEPELAEEFVPEVAKRCPVIDKSSHFRLKEDVPLIVPEVNPEAVKNHKNIIANPNCTTIPLTVAIAPLARKFGLKALNVATYQSVSGAGRKALEQLQFETECLAMNQEPTSPDPRAPTPEPRSPFPCQVAQNVIPEIGNYDPAGNTAEELKLINETRKILSLPDLLVNVTCVRVGVKHGHCLAVTARFEKKAWWQSARTILCNAPGVLFMTTDEYSGPATIAEGHDEVFVSRLRQGAVPEELNFWVMTDNLRKGAALNAVQIAELLF